MPLLEHFTQPQGWYWGKIEPRTGQHLRYGLVIPPAPKALCIIFEGFTEHAEKYFETARDLLARGFAVAVLDWRGQGMSWRFLNDPDKCYHDDFALDVIDAHTFVTHLQTIPALQNIPYINISHSMGGNILLRYLHTHPDIFKCAILSAPMLGFNFPYMAETATRLNVEAMCMMGLGTHLIPGAKQWKEEAYDEAPDLLTSDATHAHMIQYWKSQIPSLRIGGFTFGWMRAALATIKHTKDPKFLAAINTPLLIFKNTGDQIISNKSITKAAKSLPNAKIITTKGARHEILMETPTYRHTFWLAFDRFIAEHIPT